MLFYQFLAVLWSFDRDTGSDQNHVCWHNSSALYIQEQIPMFQHELVETVSLAIEWK